MPFWAASFDELSAQTREEFLQLILFVDRGLDSVAAGQAELRETLPQLERGLKSFTNPSASAPPTRRASTGAFVASLERLFGPSDALDTCGNHGDRRERRVGSFALERIEHVGLRRSPVVQPIAQLDSIEKVPRFTCTHGEHRLSLRAQCSSHPHPNNPGCAKARRGACAGAAVRMRSR